MGVSEQDFWKLTPRKINRLIEAERIRLNRQLEYDNTVAHLQGAYFAEAILSTVVNSLSSKSAKKFEYPTKPYELSLNKTNIESENDRQIELFKAQLSMSMHNFNLAHGKDEDEG